MRTTRKPLIEIFDRATNARLRTTKSIGSFLSAGLDCSSVTASAARLLGAQGKNLTAFTSVPRPDFNNISQSWLLSNEGPAASEVARLYPNIQHVLVDSTGYDLVATMKLWTDAADEPPLNVVNLLWFMGILERAKQRGIDVMLQGASGNGTISWETWGILGSFFRRGRWIKLLTTIRSLRNHGDISLKAAVRSSVGGVLPAWFNHKLIPAASLREIFSPLAHPELIRKHALSAKIFKNTFDESPDLIAEHTRFFDLVDPGPINAAAQGIAGIEFRDPTADKRVYDFCFSIPPEQYVASGHSRSLVRRAMKGRLPESTLQRYTRGRQSADWYLSMKEALPRLREEMSSLGQSPAVQQTVDLPRLQGLLDTWPESGYEEKQVYGPWHVALSRAFSMASFLRNYDSAANAVTLLIEPPTQDQPAVPVPPVAAPLN